MQYLTGILDKLTRYLMISPYCRGIAERRPMYTDFTCRSGWLLRNSAQMIRRHPPRLRRADCSATARADSKVRVPDVYMYIYNRRLPDGPNGIAYHVGTRAQATPPAWKSVLQADTTDSVIYIYICTVALPDRKHGICRIRLNHWITFWYRNFHSARAPLLPPPYLIIRVLGG
jgi:hypothetical protein